MSLAAPNLRESVMTDRRIAPLNALSTLARRPRGDGPAPAPEPVAPLPCRAGRG